MISLVTCTYNRKQQLERGLATIFNQTVPVDEVVIVDDGSTDGTQELIGAKYLFNTKVKYISTGFTEPRISCIPRNIGWKAATGDIIIFTEPEALQFPDNIHKLIKQMQEHPDNTILASQVWTMGEKIYNKLTDDDFKDPNRIISHPYAMLTDATNGNNTKAPDSDWAITGESHCNAGVLFATRKEWLEKIGGFDESFEGHGFDDFDLFNRLAIIGHGVLKVSDIPVIHQYHAKNYPYNIYEMAERNGKISEANIHKGIYKVND